MQHLNGDQICSIDTETTGLDADYHEIIQLAILPLNADLKPRKDVMPFYINMIPEHPERYSPEAAKVSKLTLETVTRTGFDQIKAIDLFEDWVGKLGLPHTPSGIRKRIIPLGQNYSHDKAFIMKWLGVDLYNDIFHYHYRDTMIAAQYLNDRAAFHAEKVPYSKVSLAWLANQHHVELDRAHDALQDCRATAEVYRAMVCQGLLG